MNSEVWGAIIHGVTKELDPIKVTEHTWSELFIVYSLSFLIEGTAFEIPENKLTILNSFYFNLPLRYKK